MVNSTTVGFGSESVKVTQAISLAPPFISYANNNFRQACVSTQSNILGRVGQLVTCLTADTGVASLIPARSHTFVEIGHEIISTAILLPSAVSSRVVVSYK